MLVECPREATRPLPPPLPFPFLSSQPPRGRSSSYNSCCISLHLPTLPCLWVTVGRGVLPSRLPLPSVTRGHGQRRESSRGGRKARGSSESVRRAGLFCRQVCIRFIGNRVSSPRQLSACWKGWEAAFPLLGALSFCGYDGSRRREAWRLRM